MPAGPSAANVLLTACHVSPYCEGRRSSGIVPLVSKEAEKAMAKGEVWVARVARGRGVFRRSICQDPRFHTGRKLSLIRCPSREKGNGVGVRWECFSYFGFFFCSGAVGRCDVCDSLFVLSWRVWHSRHGSTYNTKTFLTFKGLLWQIHTTSVLIEHTQGRQPDSIINYQ